MKILITGGAGFIGSAVFPALLKENYDVYVLDNLSFGNREFIDIPDSHFSLADIRNAEEVEEIIAELNPEIVVHLAAIHFIPYCNQHPFEAADTNIRGTMNTQNDYDYIVIGSGFFPFCGPSAWHRQQRSYWSCRQMKIT